VKLARPPIAPPARRTAPIGACVLLLSVLAGAVLLGGISPAHPIGFGPAPVGLSISSRVSGGPGSLYAADVEGVAARGSSRRAPGDARGIGAPRRTGLAGAWDSLRSSAFGRRLARVGSWVAGGVRLLWSIPKAVIKGDSSSLIEAIGNLLSGATGEQDKSAEAPRLEPDPDPSGEPSDGIIRTVEGPGLD
jgi:hypothetical protein